MTQNDQERVVLAQDDLGRTLVRIAHEIIERNGDVPFSLIGIHRRGVPLAHRLAVLIEQFTGNVIPVGELDTAFYRDDIGRREPREQASVNSTTIDFQLDDQSVVLVDDVLYTGRTVRAAIDALFDFGRPLAVQLAVLVDRGHRELPIRPDFVGKNLPTAPDERVNVRLAELDGVDEITIEPRGAVSTMSDGSTAADESEV